MSYTGGLRARLVRDNLYNMVSDSLDALGWRDAGRNHKPLRFLPESVEDQTEIPLNTLALSDEDMDSDEEELGSSLASHRWVFYLDFYAENTALGIHLINDVKAILTGRLPSIGRNRPNLVVYDLTLGGATPVVVTVCEIEDVVVDRAHDFPKSYQKYWYACRFDVVDVWADENG